MLFRSVRREPTIDFKSAVSAGLAGLADPEVLALAARENRVLVSHDQATMPDHFGRFVASRSSPGLIIVPQHVPPAVAAEELTLIWQATDAEEWTDRIFYLPL